MPDTRNAETIEWLEKAKINKNHHFQLYQKSKSGDLEQLESRESMLPDLANKFSKVHYLILHFFLFR